MLQSLVSGLLIRIVKFLVIVYSFSKCYCTVFLNFLLLFFPSWFHSDTVVESDKQPKCAFLWMERSGAAATSNSGSGLQLGARCSSARRLMRGLTSWDFPVSNDCVSSCFASAPLSDCWCCGYFGFYGHAAVNRCTLLQFSKIFVFLRKNTWQSPGTFKRIDCLAAEKDLLGIEPAHRLPLRRMGTHGQQDLDFISFMLRCFWWAEFSKDFNSLSIITFFY